MTNEQAAYVAGAIDGEGHIGLVPRWNRDGRKTPSFSFRLTISNTKDAWLSELQTWCGGYIESVSASRLTRKPCFRLRFNGHEARTLLLRVLPYLLLKKPQALLILEYFELAPKRRTSNLPGSPSVPEVVERMTAIHAELKVLNQRGIANPPTGAPKVSDRTCSLDGCGGKHYASGYCRQHYRRYVEHGGFKVYERTCVNCGSPFVARRSDTECCSKPCTDRHQYVKNREARNSYKRDWRARHKSSESA